MSTAADLIKARLRGETVDVAEHNKQSRDGDVKQASDDQQWIRNRTEELRENGINWHVAAGQAERELRQMKLDEFAENQRNRADEAAAAIAERDREAAAADTLRKEWRDRTTPVELRKMKAEERLRRRALAELDAEES